MFAAHAWEIRTEGVVISSRPRYPVALGRFLAHLGRLGTKD